MLALTQRLQPMPAKTTSSACRLQLDLRLRGGGRRMDVEARNSIAADADSFTFQDTKRSYHARICNTGTALDKSILNAFNPILPAPVRSSYPNPIRLSPFQTSPSLLTLLLQGRSRSRFWTGSCSWSCARAARPLSSSLSPTLAANAANYLLHNSTSTSGGAATTYEHRCLLGQMPSTVLKVKSQEFGFAVHCP